MLGAADDYDPGVALSREPSYLDLDRLLSKASSEASSAVSSALAEAQVGGSKLQNNAAAQHEAAFGALPQKLADAQRDLLEGQKAPPREREGSAVHPRSPAGRGHASRATRGVTSGTSRRHVVGVSSASGNSPEFRKQRGVGVTLSSPRQKKRAAPAAPHEHDAEPPPFPTNKPASRMDVVRLDEWISAGIARYGAHPGKGEAVGRRLGDGGGEGAGRGAGNGAENAERGWRNRTLSPRGKRVSARASARAMEQLMPYLTYGLRELVRQIKIHCDERVRAS